MNLTRNINKALFITRRKGLRYLYNLWWLNTFYTNSDNPLRKLLYLGLYPLFNYAPYPGAIEIEVTTRCNLRCVICEHTYWDEDPCEMDFQQVKAIVDQFPRLKWIAFTGIGENFLNKDLWRMYEYIKKKWPRIFIELYDTFYFIDEDNARRLIDLGIDRVFASIDGATGQTYESIRGGSDFKRVVRNAERLISLKKEKKAYFPQVLFHYIINKKNIDEVPAFIKFVKDLGGDGVFFTRMLHNFKEVRDLTIEVPAQVIEEANRKAGELGLAISWNVDICRRRQPLSRCTFWIMPFIYVSGDVVPCCAMNEANVRGLQKENSLGNVFKNSFSEIWKGQRYRDFRKKIRSGATPLLCRDCPVFEEV